MESGKTSFQMNLVDQRKDSRIDDDIMTRRMKNRERQRRYRARKRLEEEIKKASIVKPHTQTENFLQPSDIANGNNSSPRVRCYRNWKKDARRANVTKGSEVPCHSSNMAAITPISESQLQCLPYNITDEPQLETQTHPEPPAHQIISETPRRVLSGRDWKAEARKKNSGNDKF